MDPLQSIPQSLCPDSNRDTLITNQEYYLGFEPTPERWQRPVLTILYDIRITGTGGLEPPTF